MKNIIIKINSAWDHIVQFYITLYILFISSITFMQIWNLLLKPGHYSYRTESLYNYPFMYLFYISILFIIILFPVLVIIYLFKINRKLAELLKSKKITTL